MRMRFPIAIVLAAAAAFVGASCGGGYSNPNSPGGATPGTVGATITIRADGTAEPTEVRIAVGQTVRFINQDARQHQPTSNPHLSHTDCPGVNLPIMGTGQSQTTQNLNVERACAFHDHMNPDTAALQGVIRVGNAQGPGGPVY
jgi:plastocyanin